MTDYNKTNLIQWGVLLAIAFVIFFAIIAFIACVKAGWWWSFPIPFAAIIYGCVTFFKKYYPKKDKEDK